MKEINSHESEYLDTMERIRGRFDRINKISTSDGDEFSKAEEAAVQARRIVELIAYGCLLATDHGLDGIPRDVKGQWNAETIMKKLGSRNWNTFPSPSRIRYATDEERSENNASKVIEGIPENRITIDEFIGIYERLHKWLHESSPYTTTQESKLQSSGDVWDSIEKLSLLVGSHFISIQGEGFFCVLNDKEDHRTKVISLSKV